MTPVRKQRVCFLMQVHVEHIAAYVQAHQSVWPDMQAALRETGWGNYSLFIRESDGLVVGYLETDDFDGALAAMAVREVNDRWQQAMSHYFAGDDSSPVGGRPDETMVRLTEYFHLT